MGYLIRLFLKLLGVKVVTNTQLTFVSQTIDMLPIRDWLKPLVGGLAHLVPPAMAGLWVLAFRRDQISCSIPELATLLLAVTWCFIGPALIWYYEHHTLPALMREVERKVHGPADVEVIRTLVQRNVLKDLWAKGIAALWVTSVALGFFGSLGFVEKFGVRGYSDPLFLALFFGIIYLAIYSSIGILFALRAIRCVRVIAACQRDYDLYSSDGAIGFAYLGRFSLNTILMYLSGWVMIPVLYKVAAPSLDLYAQLWLLIVVGYSLVCLILFGVPIMILHKRIVSLKCEFIDRFGALSSGALGKLELKYDARLATQFELYRGVLTDARSIRNWPLAVDEFVKFGLSVVIFPVVVSLFAVR